jgi:hypothetical protein
MKRCSEVHASRQRTAATASSAAVPTTRRTSVSLVTGSMKTPLPWALA